MPPVPRRRPREDNPWGPGRSVRPWGPSPVSIPVPQRIIIDLIDTFNAKLDSLDVASNALLDQTTEWSVEARKQDRKEGYPEKDSPQHRERIAFANEVVVREMNQMSRYYEQLMNDLYAIETRHLYLTIQTGPYIQIFNHNNQLVRTNINQRLKSIGAWLRQTQFKGLTDPWQIPDNVDFNFNSSILLPGPTDD